MAGGKLNGYAVPYAVVAAIVSLSGLLLMNNCTRLSAVEVQSAQEIQWRKSHEEMVKYRVDQLEKIASDVDTIKSAVLLMSVRQETILKSVQKKDR